MSESIPQQTLFQLPSKDSHVIYAKCWQHPTLPSKAIVHLIHGMAEHIHRYDRLAGVLANQGITVYAHNQRGHGETCQPDQLGFYAVNDGWQKLQDDISVLHTEIRQHHHTAPLVVFGHSMGSFVALRYLIDQGSAVNGAILSGCNYSPRWLYRLAASVARLEKVRLGGKGHSAIIDALTFKSFNKTFKPNRTDFDWLSRDIEQVNRYVDDPLCGFPSTVQLWLDFFTGVSQLLSNQCLRAIPNDLPIHIMGGADDPASGQKNLLALKEKLQKIGLRDVTHQIYPGGRHEMLNEINYNEVIGDIIAWLHRYL